MLNISSFCTEDNKLDIIFLEKSNVKVITEYDQMKEWINTLSEIQFKLWTMFIHNKMWWAGDL